MEGTKPMEHHLIEDKSHFYKGELQVGNWVNTDFLSLSPGATLKSAAELLLSNEVNQAPVVDGHHRYLGILSLANITGALLNSVSPDECIEKFYDKTARFLYFSETLSSLSLSTSSIPVVDKQGVLLGMLNQNDVLAGLTQTYKKLDVLEQTIEWLTTCFDNIHEGIVVVDENGYVKMINKAYCHYLGVNQDAAVDQHVVNIIDGTRLHIVLQTGIPEHNQVQFLQGQEVVAHRIPIWKNNKIIGGIGILVFQGVSELYTIFDRIQELNGTSDLSSVNIEQPKRKEEPTTFNQVIGKSERFIHAKNIARRAAQTSASILISGESGVGKEIFTKAIHSLSKYSEGPFISVNCASIPEHLLESELFGYEEGAFTGSRKKGKPGKFLLAHKGTLFLDEIGDMPLHMQSKILRVLQEREVEPVGGSKPIPVDFRLIAATNCSIKDMVKENKFREDLYYRINVIPITIPPLRDRKEDIPLLIGQFMKTICEKYQIPPKEISKETVAGMMEYTWPGNIRELFNVMERLITLVDGQGIYFDDFQRYFLERNKPNKEQVGEYPMLERKIAPITSLRTLKRSELQKEKELLLQILQEEQGNKTRAAKKLGISRATLYNKIKEFNL
jgi:transcriptional regulator with PAS, ATPase and Fis domain